MIVSKEYLPKKSELKISYFNEQGNVSVISKKVENNEKFNWKRTNSPTQHRDFNNNFIERSKSEYLSKFRVEELIIEKLSDEEKQLIHSEHEPKAYYLDIEVESSSKEFPDPSEAKYPVNVLTIVNSDNKAFVLSNQRKLSDNEVVQMQHEINEYIKSNTEFHDMDLKVFYYNFESEKELLKFFFHRALQKIPLLSGWNVISFDWLTMVNRAQKNNIEVTKYLEAESLKGDNKVPAHIGLIDYLEVFKKFKPYKTVDRYTLDYVSNLVLGVQKLEYSGSISEFQENVYDFTKYNIIDTLLVKLIEDSKHLFSPAFNRIKLSGLQINKVFSSVALSEMLMFREFYDRNKRLPALKKNVEKQSNNTGKRDDADYSEAYVKIPNPGFYKDVAGFDFSSMYPNLTMQFNISTDSYLGKIGEDINLDDVIQKYGKKNLIITPNNTVFFTADYYYSAAKSILKKYYEKRKEYQGIMKKADHLINESSKK
jgi:DNA polymerase elongation subunit (family B)